MPSQLHYSCNALKFTSFVILAGESMAGVGGEAGRSLFPQRLITTVTSPAIPDSRLYIHLLNLCQVPPTWLCCCPIENSSLRPSAQHYSLSILGEEPVGSESAPTEDNLIQLLPREVSAFVVWKSFPFWSLHAATIHGGLSSDPETSSFSCSCLLSPKPSSIFFSVSSDI